MRDSPEEMTVALIVAAGSGERLGAGVPKAWVPLAGRPMLAHSLEALAAAKAVDRIVIAVPSGTPDTPALPADRFEVEVVAVDGGGSRSDSVRRALAAAGPGDPVLVHDAARPLVTAALAEAVTAALEADPQADAAIAAAPVTDTIKRAGRDGGAVAETLDRGELWAVQTPQVFRRAALERALDVDSETLAAATDDASLIERSGGRVIVVPAPAGNLKVTTPFDLRIAELLLAERDAGPRSDPA